MSDVRIHTLRLRRGQDDDLIAWWQAVPEEHGAKALAHKALLRLGLQLLANGGGAGSTNQGSPGGDPHDQAALLAAMRPIMVAAVIEALQQEGGVIVANTKGAAPPEEAPTEEAHAILDMFTSLGDEDDDD
jgi:hypothetical protein